MFTGQGDITAWLICAPIILLMLYFVVTFLQVFLEMIVMLMFFFIEVIVLTSLDIIFGLIDFFIVSPILWILSKFKIVKNNKFCYYSKKIRLRAIWTKKYEKLKDSLNEKD